MKSKNLERFADRMIGITITSLVLIFSLPIHKITSFQNWERSVPHLALFAFSFLILSICWSMHSKVVDLMPELSRRTVLSTRFYFVFLLGVPLSSGWLSDDIHNYSAVLLYAFNLFLIFLVFLILSWPVLKVQYGLRYLSFCSAGLGLLSMLLSYFDTTMSFVAITFILLVSGVLGYKIPRPVVTK